MKHKGHIVSLDPTFGNGGIGYVADSEGRLHFFHSSYVKNTPYKKLLVGDKVLFRRIRARSAMGASPQARDIEII